MMVTARQHSKINRMTDGNYPSFFLSKHIGEVSSKNDVPPNLQGVPTKADLNWEIGIKFYCFA